VGCNIPNEENNCKFALTEQSELAGQLLEGVCTADYISILDKNTVKVTGQGIAVGDYQIILEEYFYEKDTPSVAYLFSIVNQDGSNLSEEQFEKLVRTHESGMLDLWNKDLDESEFVNKLIRNKDGRVTWVVVTLLSAISDEDEGTNVIEKKNLQCAYVQYKSYPIQKIFLPDYRYSGNTIEFVGEGDTNFISVKVNSIGICIIRNIEDILDEYKAVIKKIPVGKSAEDYGYSAFHSISVIMNDNTEYTLYGGEQMNVMADNITIREENSLANYTALWNENIDIEEIKYIMIDNVRYEIG